MATQQTQISAGTTNAQAMAASHAQRFVYISDYTNSARTMAAFGSNRVTLLRGLLLAACMIVMATVPALASTATMYDLLWYGQSLSLGAFGQPLLTPFAPNSSFDFMMHNSCTGLYSVNHGSITSQASTCFDHLVPAYDSYFSSLANTTPAQTSITPMAEALAGLEGASAASPYFMLETGFGIGGYNYAQLASGTTPYTNMTNGLTGAVSLLPSGWALNVPAVMWVQGEADAQAGTSRSTYASNLATLQTNLSSSIETITSQTNSPPLLITQETNQGAFGNPTQSAAIMGAQWDAAVNNPGKIFLVTPLYVLENNAQQSGHLTAKGYFYLGEYMARAFRKIVPSAQGGLSGGYNAPMPTVASISNNSSAVITIPFTGGTTPYKIDCTGLVNSPNGAADGYYYTDNSGSPPSIVSVAPASNGTSILVTLSARPTIGSTATIEYAWNYNNGEGTATPGPTRGIRGCMHDSDPYTSILDNTPLPNYSIAWNASFTTN